MVSSFRSRVVCVAALLAVLLLGASYLSAQGVTTGSLTGIVRDAQGAVVPGVTVTAVHVPSGTSYETVTQGDGRFTIANMRVGSPYKVTANLSGFSPETQENIAVNLGVATDLSFSLKVAGVSETVTVEASPIFSSTHTGAATAVNRADMETLPTISGRVNDIARLSPQYTGGGTFAGQDPRMNNMTVDGAYFNNSFGLRNQPGETSGVAPISLEAIEQLQVAVAPFDVRQGNFIGAGVNTVTRSGANNFTGSVYYRYRNESFVGTDAAGQAFNPGTFKTTTFGEWAGGPIIKNKVFFFESYENQEDQRPLNSFVANPGGAPITGNMTRVLASDLDQLSSFLKSKYNYDTGGYSTADSGGVTKKTPGKPFLVKGDYNINSTNKVSFRYNRLRSSTDSNLSSSSSVGNGRSNVTSNFLSYANSNYTILENIDSGIGEWNALFRGKYSNNLIIGYTKQDESRGDVGPLFPFVDILKDGQTYTSFGSEPYTPMNKLMYNTFQAQDNFTRFGVQHSLTFGVSLEKYHSDNSYYPGIQSVYVYNSLQDFYNDANGIKTSVAKFQLRYSNVPGATVPPYQMLDVWYTGGYAQDEWRPRSNITVTGGLRFDVANFGNTGFDNPVADAMTFRDQNGNPVHYNTGALPKATPLWSPRVGFNWDVTKNQITQVRGGTGVFTGKPAYVWISNQIGNTGMLTGFIQATGTTSSPLYTYPFTGNPDTYKPAAAGKPPASTNLAVTDPTFKFPQLWRTNIAVDRKLPWFGLIATAEYIYNQDVNGMAYINANLPANQTTFAGADTRPRWTSNRINNVTGSQITENIVLMNQGVGRYQTFSVSANKPMSHGFTLKTGYTYGVSRNTVDPGSVASGSWTNNPIVVDPNNPVLAYSGSNPGHRFFLSASYTRQYFGWGATTVAAFYSTQTSGNTSYIFASDANGDSATGNDLIYIPRDTSEMNFKTLTVSKGPTFTPAQQAAAFDAYIQQDKYLSAHRGEYAARGAVFYPMVGRMDLSIMQDIFHKIGGLNHSGQIRLDITNFGNLLNNNWGVGWQMNTNRILTSPSTDSQGRLTYNLATVGSGASTTLISNTFKTSAGTSDVYVMMLSFRYTFR